MKKNVLLFGVLSFLLVVTYFFQEQRTKQEFLLGKEKGRLIPGEIERIKLPHFEAEKREGQWWSGENLLSHNSFQQLEKKLAEIKEIRPVEGGKWSDYFPEPLNFEVNGSAYVLGQMTLDRKSFYLARGESLYLGTIEGESTQLTTREEEIDVLKYEELKTLLLRRKEEVLENQLFRYYPKLPLERVSFHLDGKPDFEIDFKKNETIPSPIKGVSVHSGLQQKFLSLLTQATLKEEITYSKELKHQRMGRLVLSNGEGELAWELWLKSSNSADAVIIDDKNQRAFSMVGGTLKLFFVQLQDFWDKKVIPPKKFESFRKLPMVFTQGERTRQVQLVNSEPLRFEMREGKAKDNEMMELINYLFNLGARDQADRVSQLSETERRQVLSEDHLRVEVWDQEIVFWKKAQELILVNLTQGFKAHFILTDKTMEFDFQDVLE